MGLDESGTIMLSLLQIAWKEYSNDPWRAYDIKSTMYSYSHGGDADVVLEYAKSNGLIKRHGTDEDYDEFWVMTEKFKNLDLTTPATQ